MRRQLKYNLIKMSETFGNCKVCGSRFMKTRIGVTYCPKCGQV
ncbi:MAG: hypothetical protein ABIH76_01190 [Candidatus Bathyarchaeota archaeon]